jgi:tetratricopeptide (TPR) repeat protein/DNA-binding CsgD family transcriptional regulator
MKKNILPSHLLWFTIFFVLLFSNVTIGEGLSIYKRISLKSTVQEISFEEKLKIFKDSLSVTKRAGDELQTIRLYEKLGDLLYHNGLFVQALENFDNALRVEETDDEAFLRVFFGVYLKKGRLEQQSDNIELAIHNFTKALETAEKLEDNYLIGTAGGFLGEAYEKIQDYEKALELQHKSLTLFQELKDPTGIATIYRNIGSIYEDSLYNQKALEYFEASYEIVRGSGSDLEINVLNNLGDVNTRIGRYDDALEYYGDAIVLSEKLNDLRELESAHDDISEVYELTGDFEKAYFHKSLAKDFFEEVDEKENSRQLNVLNIMHETVQKENQIKTLQEQNTVSEIRQRIYFLAIVFFMILGALIIYIIRKRQKTELKLRTYKEELLQSKLENQKIEEENLRDNIRVKTSALSNYSLHLSNKNKLLSDISDNLRELSRRSSADFQRRIPKVVKKIDESIKSDHEWEEFKTHFEQIHPDFLNRLVSSTTQELSPSDIKLALLIRANLSSKEIASILRVSPDSVRVSRHRLRKKLPIEANGNLVSFMLKL